MFRGPLKYRYHETFLCNNTTARDVTCIHTLVTESWNIVFYREESILDTYLLHHPRILSEIEVGNFFSILLRYNTTHASWDTPTPLTRIFHGLGLRNPLFVKEQVGSMVILFVLYSSKLRTEQISLTVLLACLFFVVGTNFHGNAP